MGEQCWGRMVVVVRGDVYVVARESDPDDWLASFARSLGFPAREWAENMVRTYNRRLEPATRESHWGLVVPSGGVPRAH